MDSWVFIARDVEMTQRVRSKILIVISSLGVGGPQRSLVSLLQNVDFERFAVTLVVLNPTRSELLVGVPDCVHVLETPSIVTAATLPKQRWVRSLLALLGLLPMGSKVSLIGWLLKGVFKGVGSQQVRQHVWDIAGPHLPKTPGSYDAAIGILGLSTYAVVDLVSADNKYHWVRSDSRILGKDESVEDKYFSRLKGAVAVSKQCADILVSMYPRLSGLVSVYKNDTRTHSIASNSAVRWPGDSSKCVRLITVARLDPLKGIDVAIDACVILRAKGYRLSWLVLGEGQERSFLQRKIATKGLDDCFSLGGMVLNVEAYLASADIYVHPSLAEGRSNAVEEARGAGKAIVATRYPTVADQVCDGFDGLVSEVNAESLAGTIERLLRNPRLRDVLGREAVRRHAAELGDPNALFDMLTSGTVGRETA